MAQGKAWNKEEVVEVLRPFFELGCDIAKACRYAGIPRPTVETWVLEDNELRLKIEAWQNSINMKAREALKEGIEKGDKSSAEWWLERREKEDFSPKTETELSSKQSFSDLIAELEKEAENDIAEQDKEPEDETK